MQKKKGGWEGGGSQKGKKKKKGGWGGNPEGWREKKKGDGTEIRKDGWREKRGVGRKSGGVAGEKKGGGLGGLADRNSRISFCRNLDF